MVFNSLITNDVVLLNRLALMVPEWMSAITSDLIFFTSNSQCTGKMVR